VTALSLSLNLLTYFMDVDTIHKMHYSRFGSVSDTWIHKIF
jgi:hypothetical protein